MIEFQAFGFRACSSIAYFFSQYYRLCCLYISPDLTQYIMHRLFSLVVNKFFPSLNKSIVSHHSQEVLLSGIALTLLYR
jgi:hypothetical protein